MIADIRKQLARVPFIPFSIRTSDGFVYAVPTVDRAYVTPNGHRVVVSDDDDSVAILTPLHISGVVGQDASA
ncbi:MAG: hypothetical protein H0X34_08385 [Chthoniobacterales bacterium]|nr:hypothetical protein [Chthoniobacterales bacterium]